MKPLIVTIFDDQSTIAGGAYAEAHSDQRMSIAGAVPPKLEKILRAMPAPALPEICRLPLPKRRDPIIGASRSWHLETDARVRREGRGWIFRIRAPGARRGACFINVSKLLSYMHAEEAADHARDAEGADVETQSGTEVQP